MTGAFIINEKCVFISGNAVLYRGLFREMPCYARVCATINNLKNEKNKFSERFTVFRGFKYAGINNATMCFLNSFILSQELFDVQQWLVTAVLWYNQLGMNDVDRVGGKNASTGEMITNLLSGMGVSVPNGFAATADAFNRDFWIKAALNQRIYELLDRADIDDVSSWRKRARKIASGYRHSFPAGAGKRHPRCLHAFVG